MFYRLLTMNKVVYNCILAGSSLFHCDLTSPTFDLFSPRAISYLELFTKLNKLDFDFCLDFCDNFERSYSPNTILTF